MEITSIESFISYYEKTRVVTKQVVSVIPHDKLDWTYLPGKFTIGDLVRHIAAIERYVFAEVALGKKPNYHGCGKGLADGYEGIVSYLDEMHGQSLEFSEQYLRIPSIRKFALLTETRYDLRIFFVL